MKEQSRKKETVKNVPNILYNLRERKSSRKKTKMGVKFAEDTVQLLSSEDRFIDDNKKLRAEAGDGLYEDVFSISEGDSDEVMLLTEEYDKQRVEPESSLTILTQVMLPFLVAGLGMVGAGIVLDSVQHWDVFITVNELFIMVPALLGLKGNLEMTLASRLSTHSNLGHLDSKKSCLSLVAGNLALIQCQALVVGFLASMAAVLMGWITIGYFDIKHAILLCSSAMVTASLASFILGLIMVGVILLSRHCKINPDNVATPIAASLGDLITLMLLSGIASFLFAITHIYWAAVIPLFYLCSMPLWVWLASRNESTKQVLYTGWVPVIAAMFISSIGGVILDKAVAVYKGIAVYQPVVNGVGGNLVAVQASRMSTSLHMTTSLGHLPSTEEKVCISPLAAFSIKDGHPRTARILLLLVIPGHLAFIYMIYFLQAGHTSPTPQFLAVYSLVAVLQVIILLYIAQVMIMSMWKNNIDPDNSAIPYLTALGDFLGTAFLAVGFNFLYIIGDRDGDLGD